ncbi:MAG: cell wall-binding protein [Hungatella sp.]|nr:cell wall-binding protein [Hungatella sp.]
MKKHIRLTAVLSTAVVMTAFAPVLTSPVLAQSTGWVQENEDWKYYDSDGYYLTDTWKKKDDAWYYLDEDGDIALDRQIDEYYVGSDGKRVVNQWVIVPNEDYDGSEDSAESYWYYYGKDGKMTVSKFRTVNDQVYYFDSDGRMVIGLVEIDGANYYFGKEGDGSMKKGWVQLVNDTDDADLEITWSYFNSDGQRIENQVDKKIGGNYYTFENGKMVTGWYKLPEEAAAADNAADLQTQDAAADNTADAQAQDTADSAAGEQQAPSQDDASANQQEVSKNAAHGYQYYNEDGSRASGWMIITGIPNLSDEDEVYKFYFKSGVPYFAESGLEIFRIGTAHYCFNENGEMQTGLQVITLEDGSKAKYYFGTDGAMKTGKQSILDEESGVTQTWFFHTDSEKLGQGFHGIRDNVIYINGLRQQAESYMRYAPVTFEGQNYLVNASGTIQKASASSKSSERPELGAGYRDLKDSSENIWTIDVNGIIQPSATK